MPSVLFVCTANICRSPLAEGLFRLRLQQSGQPLDDWQIGSAGTWTVDGRPAAPEVIRLMQARGVDLSSHRSRMVSTELLAPCNLILTMEHGQKEALRVEFAALAQRVYLLSEMAGRRMEIEDPFGGPESAYQHAAAEIDFFLAQGWDNLLRLAGGQEKRTGSQI